MTAGIVTGIANARHAHFEELRVVAAVWFMAIRAVFHHWRVLPDKWAAPLRVAGQAILVGGALNELLGIGRAVRIVATGAGYLAFSVRHVRRALQLRSPHLMTLQAQFGLGFFHPLVFRKGRVEPSLRRSRYMQFLFDLMTGHARYAAGLMRAALPEQMVSPRMAFLAFCVLLSHGVI